VRAQAGLGWTGRVNPVEVVLADAELDGALPGDAAQVVAGRGGLLFAFRLGERTTWRLLATRPATPGRLEPGSFGRPVSAVDLQALIDQADLDARVTDLRWSSRVTVQRRAAHRFPAGPALPGRGRDLPAVAAERELPGQPPVGGGDAAPSRRSPCRRPAARPARPRGRAERPAA
jgi:hypothetical protein